MPLPPHAEGAVALSFLSSRCTGHSENAMTYKRTRPAGAKRLTNDHAPLRPLFLRICHNGMTHRMAARMTSSDVPIVPNMLASHGLCFSPTTAPFDGVHPWFEACVLGVGPTCGFSRGGSSSHRPPSAASG